ncbi:RecBCD enzyme subunit RecC [Amycolatopsis deserti]|uniref:RecBCD enzyme subunit RecC n=1 Tax=Amycolatopsis deserti TaxID=185696 RepID=A0ABQ3IC47_9PSEU|nr:exodeoxyribonuclease V subunit gamma [Amycolatopsis deserti]GHE78000.1 RecBCD enzyme subunit RecC [Amycolatopsis deserti]
MLTVHRAESAGTLVGALAELLRAPPDDPFAPEVVAVPAKGVERWLAQRLSATLGIAANIDFPHPDRLVAGALAAGGTTRPEDDPWAPGRLLWTVLEVIDDCLAEPWCALLAHHLGAADEPGSHRRGRRYSTAEAVTRLFRAYGENRPAMLTDWAAGVASDGAGGTVDEDLAWQVELWRRVRARAGVPSPAEQLADACRRLSAEPGLVDLPRRVSLFGPTRLPHAHLEVLGALADHRDVHLWLTHPSPAMWETLAGHPAPVRRAQDDSAAGLRNPLLAGLSRDVRELQHRLRGRGADVHHPGREPGTGTLAAVRADIAADRPPGAAGLVRHDGTIAIHACHGAARQVEVLREALLGLLAADDTLQPRDIIVMCPDVDAFAPLITAAFGQPGSARHPGHRLRVRLADRGPARTNPVLDIVSTLLRLADGRVTAGEVLDLAASEPVARRFGFTADAVETLRTWTVTAGARWGLGERQRAAHGLAGVRQNTFATALDRLLLGVAADESEHEWLGLALPLDDVDSSDVDLAGRFAELADRLAATLARLAGEQPAVDWTAALESALDLLTAVPPELSWQRVQASRELAAANEHAGATRLRLADVRSMLARRLDPRPTRSNFRTGDLTVCTLVPMRSVPHRVVALIGLDDDLFPRDAGADGDDVLARDPCAGERDPRSEDRQLLLDAVLAATDHLLICYTGADPVTGAVRPPAAPLAELIDVVRATVTDPGAVVTRQPLQPFDAANFAPPAPASFDSDAFAAARAARRPSPPPPFLPAPLAPVRTDIALDDLVAFLANPARAFLRQRLGITLPGPAGEIGDALPLAVDGLVRWEIGTRMLAAALAGAALPDLCQAELRRGTLPAGRLGTTAVDAIARSVDVVRNAAAPHLDVAATSVDVTVALPGHRRITGTVAGVRGTVLLNASYSALSPRQRVAAWARLLAVAAATGDPGWRAVTIGPVKAEAPAARRSTLAVPSGAGEILVQLADLHDRGMAEPLPLAPAAAERYAARRLAGMDAEEARLDAARAWTGGTVPGENADEAVRFVHGTGVAFERVWDTAPRSGEQWPAETSRFGVLARRVWDPLLGAEEVGPA